MKPNFRILWPLLVLSFPVWAHAEKRFTVAATLQIDAGAVQLREHGDQWKSLESGASVEIGSLIETSLDFEGELRFDDGTTLKVRPSTSLQLLDDGLRLLVGSVWIKVTKSGSQFRMETPGAVASVRGTIFTGQVEGPRTVFREAVSEQWMGTTTRHAPEAPRLGVLLGLEILRHFLQNTDAGTWPTQVDVFEGVVEVTQIDTRTGKPGRTERLIPGQGATLRRQALATAPVPAATYEFWRMPLPEPPDGASPGTDESPTGPVNILQTIPDRTSDQ